MGFVDYPDSLTREFWERLDFKELQDLVEEKKFLHKLVDLENTYEKILGESDCDEFRELEDLFDYSFEKFGDEINTILYDVGIISEDIKEFYSRLKDNNAIGRCLVEIKADIILFHQEIDSARRQALKVAENMWKRLWLSASVLSKCVSVSGSFGRSLGELVGNPCDRNLQITLRTGDQFLESVRALYIYVQQGNTEIDSFISEYIIDTVDKRSEDYWVGEFLRYSSAEYQQWIEGVARLKEVMALAGQSISDTQAIAALMTQAPPQIGRLRQLERHLERALDEVRGALGNWH